MARTPILRAEGFNRRAGKFIDALYSSLNGETFVAVQDISNETVAAEQPENTSRTVSVLSNMGYIETATDAEGRQTLRLTPAGVVQQSIRVKSEV